MFNRIKKAFSELSNASDNVEKTIVSREEEHKKDYILRMNPLVRGDIYLHRFRVKAPLGRGGYSEIYLVYDMTQKRDVALKLYRLDGQLEHVKNYIERDGLISQRFVHDPIEGLITNYEVGKLPNGYGLYICQEYVENSNSLHDQLESEYSLDPISAVNTAIKLCTTLERLHQRGVYHCDIKPLNILTTPAGEPILIDLGAARLSDEPIPQYAVATIPYASYEMLNGEFVDGRTDIYSLGITLLHMLVGLPEWVDSLGAYKDYTTAAITPRFLQLQPTPEQLKEYTFKSLLAVPSSEIATSISKAIQVNPDDRYQTIAEFKNDLSNYLKSQQQITETITTDTPLQVENPNKETLSQVSRFLVYRLQFALNHDELKMLCFDLSVPYENIMPPNATLDERILLMVQYLERREHMVEIINWIVENRPNLDMKELVKFWIQDGRSISDLPPNLF